MMLLSRPALCAYATRLFFFRCHHYQSQPQPRARLILPVTQFGGVVKPLIHTVGSRSISAGVTNDRPIDSPLMQSMETKIKDQLNAELVTVKDAYGDGRHVSIDVVSSDFEGKSAVNRQRMVYKAIWEELQSVVHAVDQMTTRTPEEAAAAGKD
ncbi:putative BolA protein [Helianthus annuus]|uniref:BolA protein n=1 Tax=Helianthus annuus TaxID=4232 RepID=A0A251UNX0_HELAN|nr:protein BOLA4, chloroplastic/mitochondrial [Helianthus annuus]KAF5805409.1 putative BolA protein [Helianthus annuus]KAJ0576482.1 putative BolA protein [Helianthus annuus]KAJ0584173.1 putative BolA protein [Helianthus annuus]KAJ0630613.1 putative BolA protein [Helianthus annuus]KAJ0746750.1 putative BolA protein [Helianthus annuus]